MARKTLTDLQIAAIRPAAKRQQIPDPHTPGLYVRISPQGARSFVAVARDPAGKQIWVTLAATGIDAARLEAGHVKSAIKAGTHQPAKPISAPQATTFGEAAAQWLRQEVTARGFRTAAEIERLLRLHLLPAWGGLPIETIKRRMVADLLDKIEAERGARTAYACQTWAGQVFRWYEKRGDDFVSPIRGNVTSYKPAEHRRARVLSDDEIRQLWAATADGAPVSRMVRLLLLTAQRREKIEGMRREDISGDTWTVPADTRAKGTGEALVLPAAALAELPGVAVEGSPWVFPASRGDGHRRIESKAKVRLDAAAGFVGWTLHDLRRTARTLMSRAGVASDTAERVLGHQQEGVEGIYDRHAYVDEKAAALAALAALVGRIVNPPADNVVPIARTAT